MTVSENRMGPVRYTEFQTHLHGGTLCAQGRETAPVQVLLPCGPLVVEGAPRDRPGRGRPHGSRHPLHRDQSDGRSRAEHLYEKLYCARGQAENHIKGWKTHLASVRTSCSKASANQMRVRRAYAAPQGPRSRLTAARLRLLAVVDTARGLPETLAMAARPVRHVAAAPDQTGCHHRREENPDHHHTAGLLPASKPYPAPVRSTCPATPGMTQTSRPAHPQAST